MVERVEASGPKKRGAHVVLDADHVEARGEKRATDSEPISPPDPVTMAVGMA